MSHLLSGLHSNLYIQTLSLFIYSRSPPARLYKQRYSLWKLHCSVSSVITHCPGITNMSEITTGWWNQDSWLPNTEVITWNSLCCFGYFWQQVLFAWFIAFNICPQENILMQKMYLQSHSLEVYVLVTLFVLWLCKSRFSKPVNPNLQGRGWKQLVRFTQQFCV